MLDVVCLVAALVVVQPEPERELRNYAAELNAPILAIPVEERAWTVYKRAILAIEPAPKWFESGWPDAPTQDEIDDATEYFERNKDAIELVREAASMPRLGYVLQDAREPVFERALAVKEGREPILRTPNENPFIQGILLWNLKSIQELSRTMVVDCRIAGLVGDADRLEADIVALLGLSGHALEQPYMVSQLASQARADAAFRQVRWTLAHHSQLLSTDQINHVRQQLHSTWPDRRIHSSVGSITNTVEDAHQRSFDKDGLITVEGIGLLQSLSGVEKVDHEVNEKMFWFWGSLLLREPDMQQMLGQQINLIEEYIQTPLWEHDNPTCNDKSEELFGAVPLRYGFLGTLIPSGDDIARAGEYATQVRDATLVTIALELFRREHGAFPQALDELVPEFLDEVPPDRFDGKPLKYQLMQSGPLLYSVGTDRDDDDGKAAEIGHALNWFTPTEVQAARRGERGAPFIPDGDWILFPPD